MTEGHDRFIPAALEPRSQRMSDAWRRRDQEQDGEKVRGRTLSGATRRLDDARAAADAAYQERKVRLANAWRSR